VILEPFGLDGVDGAARPFGFQRERAAPDEPAAAARRIECVEREVPGARRARELERERALPRDDVRMIERRHDRSAAALGDSGRDGLTVLALAVVEHDFRAVLARSLDFDFRRVCRHHDRRGHFEPARGQCHGLRVVSRRESDDACGALVGTELQQAIQRAADLEATRVLKAFGLEQDARADSGVDDFRLEHRRLDDPAAQARLGVDDVSDCGKNIRHRGYGA